jgi:glutamyl-tRNA synthetase
MRIDEVVRGHDLLSSTARQILLAELLGFLEPVRWIHLPLVVGPDGERLAKRHQSKYRGSTIAELREAGVSAREIVDVLASAFEWDPRPRRSAAFRVPDRWVQPR